MTIGIDIGAQSAKFGLVNAQGKIIKQAVIPSTQDTFSEFLDDICLEIKKLLVEVKQPIQNIKGIGIGAPNGNYYTGCIEFAPNVTWANKASVNLANSITERLSIPCTITNDANAAAMGEMIYGAARGMRNFIMITLGTGVGSGIVVNGEVVYGHDGLAGELGHMCINRFNGRQCGCGRKGCLETYTSAMGVARTAIEMLEESNINSSLRNIPTKEMSSKHVYNAAINGDKLAMEIFEKTGKILGEAMSDFVTFLSPEAIILFGGLTKAGDLILNPIIEHMNENLISFWKGKIKVLTSALPESDAAILGASALAYK